MSKPRNDAGPIGRQSDRPKPIHWLFLLSCIVFYFALMAALMLLAQQEIAAPGMSTRYYWLGVMAQLQVMAVILITLNPIRNSYWVGIALCGVSIVATLQRFLFTGAINALPGVLIPANTIVIALILYRHKTRSVERGRQLALSNELLQKVLDTIPMPIF